MQKIFSFRHLKNECKENINLSLPLIASQLIYSSSGFIGTALIARLGEDALAASVLVSMVWMSLSVLFFGIFNSISVLVAFNFGKDNKKNISEIMGQSFLMGLIVIFLIIALLAGLSFLLQYSSQPKTVITLANEYLHALWWSIPGLVMLIIYEQFLAGIAKTKFVLRISLLIVPIEIPLIYLLITGKFGFPQCGVAGIGFGFAITYTLTAVGMTIYFLKSNYYQNFQLFNQIKTIHRRWIKELIQIGLPIGCMHFIEVGAFTIMTFWIGHFGTKMLAAHQIVMQYLGFMITIAFSLAQAITIRVGYSHGKGDLTTLVHATYVGFLFNLIFALMILMIFILFPTLLLKIDIDIYNPSNFDLVDQTKQLLLICSFLIFFDSFRIIGFGVLRGLKDTRFSMFVSFIAFGILGLSFAFILGFFLNWENSGIWWGMTIGIAIGALLILLRTIQQLRSGMAELN